MSILDKSCYNADWVVSNIRGALLSSDELVELKAYWFIQWNYKTGTSMDKKAYEAVSLWLSRLEVDDLKAHDIITTWLRSDDINKRSV